VSINVPIQGTHEKTKHPQQPSLDRLAIIDIVIPITKTNIFYKIVINFIKIVNLILSTTNQEIYNCYIYPDIIFCQINEIVQTSKTRIQEFISEEV
jgi:hypothetical protein